MSLSTALSNRTASVSGYHNNRPDMMSQEKPAQNMI